MMENKWQRCFRQHQNDKRICEVFNDIEHHWTISPRSYMNTKGRKQINQLSNEKKP